MKIIVSSIAVLSKTIQVGPNGLTVRLTALLKCISNILVNSYS